MAVVDFGIPTKRRDVGRCRSVCGVYAAILDRHGCAPMSCVLCRWKGTQNAGEGDVTYSVYAPSICWVADEVGGKANCC